MQEAEPKNISVLSIGERASTGLVQYQKVRLGFVSTSIHYVEVLKKLNTFCQGDEG